MEPAVVLSEDRAAKLGQTGAIEKYILVILITAC